MTEELFTGAYSPRRIRFYLGHFDLLQSLVEWPSNARDAGQALAREWALLVDNVQYDHLDCLCHLLNDGIASPGSFRSGSGGGIPRGITTLADLTQAADRLPYRWRATRHIYTLQNRLGAWEFRFAVASRITTPRPLDRLLEPPSDPDLPPLRTGGGAYAVRLMALSLGWLPRPQHPILDTHETIAVR